MSTGLVEPHGQAAPGFRFHSPVVQTAHVSSGLSACWAGHCQSRPCLVWNLDFPPLGAVIVVQPAAPIDAATVVAQVVSVVVVGLEAVVAVVVDSVVAIAVRLRPGQPAPSAAHSVIAHSVIAHHPIDLLRTVPRAVVLSVTGLLAIGPSVTAQALRATVAQHSSLVTAPPGRMRAGLLPVQRARNAGLNQPARTSFGGCVRLRLAEFLPSLHLVNRGPRSGRV
jgi:hypothetical protein